MEPEDVLKELALTDSETAVYMALLRNGPATASALSKHAGIHRRLAYDVVESLTEKGLLSYTDKENKRIYKACDPHRLEEIIEDRRSALSELDQKVSEILPELMTHYAAEQSEREVKVMEGKEGIKHIFNDELRVGETIHLIGSPAESEDILKYFLPTYNKRRERQGVTIKGVFEHRMRDMADEHPLIDCRYLPDGQASSVSMCIYGDNVGIIFWIDNPLVIMIHDEQAAESFLSYWQLVWDGATE